jgi:hypothetical protein
VSIAHTFRKSFDKSLNKLGKNNQMTPYNRSYPNIPKLPREEETGWGKIIKVFLFIIIWGWVLWQIASLATKGSY